MMIIPHLLVGAAIGLKIKRVGWIIPIGIFSHFILDKIPHWDYGNGALEEYRRDKSKRPLLIFFLKLIIDGSIGLAIISFIIWQKGIISLNILILIAVGIFSSILPDLIFFIDKFFPSKFSEKYSYIHRHFLHCKKHIQKPTVLGVGTQVLVSAIAILILLI